MIDKQANRNPVGCWHTPFKKIQALQNADWSNQRFGNYLGNYAWKLP